MGAGKGRVKPRNRVKLDRTGSNLFELRWTNGHGHRMGPYRADINMSSANGWIGGGGGGGGGDGGGGGCDGGGGSGSGGR
uniref:Uncharacterized protein n=1 Tax=Vespula pensylvanica TaxID=30213 RepID=A0A834U5B5_VESPE|nr:hypothetical protein H0235_011579 [Vespula pensylvanica]